MLRCVFHDTREKIYAKLVRLAGDSKPRDTVEERVQPSAAAKKMP
jgi:hypothetical protein